MEDPRYDLAVRRWLARRMNEIQKMNDHLQAYDEDSFTNVNFVVDDGGGCPTCSFSEVVIEFRENYLGRESYGSLTVPAPAVFVQEVVALLDAA